MSPVCSGSEVQNNDLVSPVRQAVGASSVFVAERSTGGLGPGVPSYLNLLFERIAIKSCVAFFARHVVFVEEPKDRELLGLPVVIAGALARVLAQALSDVA